MSTKIGQNSALQPQYAEFFRTFVGESGTPLFPTFTTAYPLSESGARGLMKRVGSGFRQLDSGFKGVWVAERFEMRYGYHTHGLVSFSPDFIRSPFSIQALCEKYQILCGSKVNGNVNGKLTFDKWHNLKLIPINQTPEDWERVSGYISKYIVPSRTDRFLWDFF